MSQQTALVPLQGSALVQHRAELVSLVTPEVISEFMYSIKRTTKSGKDIEIWDINADGINFIAELFGVSVEDVEILDETDEYFEIKSVAVKQASGRQYPVIHREYKHDKYGKEKDYALRTGITIANRSSQKGCLPMTIIRLRMKKAVHGKPIVGEYEDSYDSFPPPETRLPAGDANDTKNNSTGDNGDGVRKAFFAELNKRNNEIKRFFRTVDTFKSLVRARYNCKSFTEFEPEFYADALNGLNHNKTETGLNEWVRSPYKPAGSRIDPSSEQPAAETKVEPEPAATETGIVDDDHMPF